MLDRTGFMWIGHGCINAVRAVVSLDRMVENRDAIRTCHNKINLPVRFFITHCKIIQWNANKGDDQSRPGKLWLIDDQQGTKTDAHQHIHHGQNRITKGLIGPVCIRIFLT